MNKRKNGLMEPDIIMHGTKVLMPGFSAFQAGLNSSCELN